MRARHSAVPRVSERGRDRGEEERPTHQRRPAQPAALALGRIGHAVRPHAAEAAVRRLGAGRVERAAGGARLALAHGDSNAGRHG